MVPKGSLKKIQEYYMTNKEYSDEIMRAIMEFYERPDLKEDRNLGYISDVDSMLFNEWFTYDFLFSDGRNAITKFYEDNPLSIPEYRRRMYKDLRENYFGIFEVLEVESFKSLTLRKLDDEKEFRVLEFSATMDVTVGDIMINRIGRIDDHYELVGAPVPSLGASEEKDPVLKLRKLKSVFPNFKVTPIDVRRILHEYF